MRYTQKDKQMTFNNKGYDYLMENCRGVNVRIEEKYRNKGNKYEITPAQEKIVPDVFTLRTHDGKHYHMLAKTYHKLDEPHSFLQVVIVKKSLKCSTTDLSKFD